MIVHEEPDYSVIAASFNIMPGKRVTERLLIREYRVEEDQIECLFDREYLSEMHASPTHLTMITLPLLTQRLTYVWCCHRFALPYRPREAELLKVWPDRLEQSFPKLLKAEKSLLYRFKRRGFTEISPRRYYLTAEGRVNDILTVAAGATILLL
jgi:hypothetical protein